MNSPWTVRRDALLLHVWLTPKSSRDDVEGIVQLADGSSVLQARVRAVPENGKANEALVRLLAARLRVPVSRVRVETGAGSRLKTIRIEGDTGTLVASLTRALP